MNILTDTYRKLTDNIIRTGVDHFRPHTRRPHGCEMALYGSIRFYVGGKAKGPMKAKGPTEVNGP